jgi:hypothetical protein
MSMLSGVGFPLHRDLSPVEFQISRHTLAAMVLFAPPIASPFLPLADGTELPPPAGGIGDYMAGNFAQRPLRGLGFFYMR